MRRRILTGGLLASWLAAQGAAAATFVDSFDDGVIDATWWTVTATGGSVVVETGGRIELTQGASGAAGLTFNVPLTGDFDARIDFALLDWPSDNRERLALGDGASAVHLLIERTSDSTVGVGTEVYVTDFSGQGILGTPTSDGFGTLRLQRVGDVVEGSFWTGSGWQVIGSYAKSGEGDVARPIGFAIFPGFPVGSGVRVGIDSFRIEGASVPAPEPGLLALFTAAAASWVGLRIRRS